MPLVRTVFVKNRARIGIDDNFGATRLRRSNGKEK